MKGPNAAVFRVLVPAVAVSAVLALSLVAPSPSLGSSTDLAYGYANNCGVKGDGFHDHGKACPNRPFPGKGKGLNEAIASGNNATTSSETGATANPNIETTETVGTSATAPTGGATTSLVSNGHGKGHSHGRGRSSR